MKVQVAIIGSGPAGMAAALSILKFCSDWAEVSIYERNKNVTEHVGVQCESYRFCHYSTLETTTENLLSDNLGLGDAKRWNECFGEEGMNISKQVEALIRPSQIITYMHGKSGKILWSREPGLQAGKYIPQVKRAALLQTIHDALPPGIIQYQKMVTEWTQDPNGVNIKFGDGSCVRADYVIAAGTLQSL